MNLNAIVIPLASGASDGILLFLVASGLTLIFGVRKLLNFAHGGFFMVGAYLGYQLALSHELGLLPFLGVIVAASIGTGIVGIVVERFVFIRLYGAKELESILGTFALFMILQGLGQVVWGVDAVSQPMPPFVAGALVLGQVTIPRYTILLAIVTVVVLAFLEWLIRFTRFGMYLRAVAEDQDVAMLLGIDGSWVSRVATFVGVALAGLGGALAAPTLSLLPDIAGTFIIQAFAVVIIGGLGSVYGALVAALLTGIANGFAVTYAPGLSGYSLYILMFVILILRPQGIFGTALREDY